MLPSFVCLYCPHLSMEIWWLIIVLDLTEWRGTILSIPIFLALRRVAPICQIHLLHLLHQPWLNPLLTWSTQALTILASFRLWLRIWHLVSNVIVVLRPIALMLISWRLSRLSSSRLMNLFRRMIGSKQFSKSLGLFVAVSIRRLCLLHNNYRVVLVPGGQVILLLVRSFCQT